MRFTYEYHDDASHWIRSYGNEYREFNEAGFMTRRFASVNDLPIQPEDRANPRLPISFGSIRPVAVVHLGPFGARRWSLGYVSRAAPSVHVPRRRPAADGSSFTSLRGPPDCRSPGTMSARNRGTQPCVPQRRAWLGCGAHERRREAQGPRPRAQRDS